MKKCKKCHLDMAETEFYRNHDECKRCWNQYCSKRIKEKKELDPNYLNTRRVYLQEWRKNNPEKQKKYTKTSLEKNKDKINAKRKSPEARKALNESVKDWRRRNPERFKETERLRKQRKKEQTLAVAKINQKISRGLIIKPSKCEKCQKDCNPEGHHEDYSKPLEVKWLCHVCHRHAHGKLLDVKP